MRDFSIVGDRPVIDRVHTDSTVTPIEDTHEDDEPPVQSFVIWESLKVVIGLSRGDTEEEGRES